MRRYKTQEKQMNSKEAAQQLSQTDLRTISTWELERLVLGASDNTYRAMCTEQWGWSWHIYDTDLAHAESERDALLSAAHVLLGIDR
jgi:hypothetical protein